MCCRARTPKNFQVRANMMIKKKSVKKICCYDQKQQPPIFSLLLVFVVICCRNKKMLLKCCPTIKEHFLFRKFFSKSLSNVSTDPGHRWYTFLTKILHTKKKFPHACKKRQGKTILMFRKSRNFTEHLKLFLFMPC